MANVVRIAQEDLYSISTQTASISTAGVFSGTGNIGTFSGKFMIPLTNHPHLDIGQGIIDTRKATGTSDRRIDNKEFQQGIREPTTTFEFEANVYNLAPILWTLFQKGTSEAGTTPFEKTYVPYSAGDCEVWLSLLRRMSTASANSHQMDGAICSSITLSAEAGGPLTASAEFIGYDVARNIDVSGANYTDYDQFYEKAPLLWQDFTIELNGSAINTAGFTVTITNNAAYRHYNSQTPTRYTLHDCGVEGSVTMTWYDVENAELNNFVNGTDSLIHIYTGTKESPADGEITLAINARYTGATVTGEEETSTELPFVGAHDGTNDAIKIYLADALNRGIP